MLKHVNYFLNTEKRSLRQYDDFYKESTARATMNVIKTRIYTITTHVCIFVTIMYSFLSVKLECSEYLLFMLRQFCKSP